MRVPTRSSSDPNASADINTLQSQIDSIEAGTDIKLTLDGNAYVGTKILGVVVSGSITLGKVYAKVDNAPVGADLQIDVNKNLVSIFTTQANRPIITDGTTSDESADPDVTTAVKGDILSIDIDQVGSTTPGGNFLYINIQIS